MKHSASAVRTRCSAMRAAWAAVVLVLAGPATAFPRRLPFIVYAGADSDQKWALYTMGIDGSDPVQLTGDGRRDDAIVVYGVSRDGSRLLASVDRGDGFALEALAQYSPGDLLGAWHPSWSPDESMVVFTGNYQRAPGVLASDIFVLNIRSRQVEQLTDFGGRDPAWSPDGARIAFTSSRDNTVDIFVMDANGDNVRNLTDDGEVEEHPAWSPDGTTIVFSQGDKLANHDVLHTVSANGGGERLVADPGANYAAIWYPSWSSDGQTILFSASDVGSMGSDIFRVRPDGSDLRRLTSNAFNLRFARHPFLVGYPLPVSPTGSRATQWARLRRP